MSARMRAVVAAVICVAAIAHASPETREPLVIFLGDSLTAGFGVSADEGFPAVVAKSLREKGRPIRAVNAGVAGDVTSGALQRLPRLLGWHPDVLVVEIGVNDAAANQPVDSIAANIRRIVQSAKAAGARVLLLGVRIPVTEGAEIAGPFNAMYSRIARVERVDLMPNLLEGVEGNPKLSLGDGVHPNPEGHRIVAANLLGYVERAVGTNP